jgi:hypothetical protein
MERDVGDVLDRWSISKLKSERIGLEENIKEYEAYANELKLISERYKEYDWIQMSKLMYDVNDFIWQLESGLKSGKEALDNPHYILDKINKEALFHTVFIAYKNLSVSNFSNSWSILPF